MTTALYRISSNEVIKISIADQSFSNRNMPFFAVLTDPTTPDGASTRDLSTDPVGPLRVLGFAKIAEPGGNNIRNATQLEIDAFVTLETDDINQLDADQAGSLFQTHPQFRKMMAAFADILKDEINILRARNVQFQNDVAAAANLGQLKTAVALYSTQSDRTLAQLKTQINNRISKDD